MGYQTQLSTGIDDCQQFTLSTWVKYLDPVDESSDLSMLFQFGNTDTSGADSVIGINQGDQSLRVMLVGARYLFLGANYGGAIATNVVPEDSANIFGGAFDLKPGTVAPNNANWSSDVAPLPGASISFGTSTPGWRTVYLDFRTSANILAPSWNHIFIAADMSAGFVNRTVWTHGSIATFDHFDQPVSPFVPPIEPPTLYSPAFIYVNNASVLAYDGGHDGEVHGKATTCTVDATDGSFSTSAVNNNPTGRDGALLSGYPISHPGTYPKVVHDLVEIFADAGTERKVFAYTQVWFNQFIDPTGTTTGVPNLDFFRTVVSGGIIPPVDVFAAQTAFGTSDIFFYRNKVVNTKGQTTTDVKYTTNQGTGGPFSVIGTPPADYTPGPGQAGTPGLTLGDVWLGQRLNG